MNVLSELMRFQTDRNLHMKPYNWNIETTNIIEELFEAIGINDRRMAELTVGDMSLIKREFIMDGTIKQVAEEDIIDAFADVIVFATGAIAKLGYDPEKVLSEVAKEINSREGEMKNGKFVKYKTKEAMSKWYKADFSNCKLELKEMEDLRAKFFNEEGYMASDQEVKKWALDKK